MTSRAGRLGWFACFGFFCRRGKNPAGIGTEIGFGMEVVVGIGSGDSDWAWNWNPKTQPLPKKKKKKITRKTTPRLPGGTPRGGKASP